MVGSKHTTFYDGIFQQKGRERLTPTSPRANPFCWKTPSKKEYGVLTTLWRAFVSLWFSMSKLIYWVCQKQAIGNHPRTKY